MSSNLGDYQEIVVQAKAAGGVGQLLAQIKAGAIEEAAPRLLGQGAVAGLVAGASVVLAAWKGRAVVQELKGRRAERRNRMVDGVAAEEKLTALIDSDVSPDEPSESTVESKESSNGE